MTAFHHWNLSKSQSGSLLQRLAKCYVSIMQRYLTKWTKTAIAIIAIIDTTYNVKGIDTMAREYTKSQRALQAARISDAPHKRPMFGEQRKHVTIAVAATRFAVSPRQVAQAKRILRECAPDIIERIEAGQLTVSAALPPILPNFNKCENCTPNIPIVNQKG